MFEWNGPMLHSKTAVADCRWARVGSSNLNIASWMSNYELDVAVEDEGFAMEMQEMYEHDLACATEIVLSERNRVRPATWRPRRRHRVAADHCAAAGRAGSVDGVVVPGQGEGVARGAPQRRRAGIRPENRRWAGFARWTGLRPWKNPPDPVDSRSDVTDPPSVF